MGLKIVIEVKVTYEMEQRGVKQNDECFFLRTPLHHYKGAYKCLKMLHSVCEYINDVCKVADDLRRAKAKHEAGNNQIASHVTMMLKKPPGYLRNSAHY